MVAPLKETSDYMTVQSHHRKKSPDLHLYGRITRIILRVCKYSNIYLFVWRMLDRDMVQIANPPCYTWRFLPLVRPRRFPSNATVVMVGGFSHRCDYGGSSGCATCPHLTRTFPEWCDRRRLTRRLRFAFQGAEMREYTDLHSFTESGDLSAEIFPHEFARDDRIALPANW